MLSRVAESTYWMARYIERAENTARFIEASLNMSLDAPLAFSDQWKPLVAATGDLEHYEERYEDFDRDSVIHFLALDPENPSSIASCLISARENARSIREVISVDTWEQVNRFYLMVSRASSGQRIRNNPGTFLDEVKQYSHLVAGAADATISHNEVWHFMQLGRLLERADNTSRMLDVKYFLLLPSSEDVGGAVDEMEWSILLRSTTALTMYRRRFGTITPNRVIEFLLLDPDFPRSILSCLLHAEQSVHAITGTPTGRFSNLAERRIGQLRSEFAYSHIDDVLSTGMHEFLDRLQLRLNHIGDAISETFFGLHRPDFSLCLEAGQP